MSILGTCQECLHHKDGMCNLRPRICVNYDHFVWDKMIVISKNDLEQKYVSRFALDAANARAEKAEARADALQADKKRIEAQLSVMSAAVCMIAGNHPDLFTGEVQSASLTIARTFAPWVKKGGEK